MKKIQMIGDVYGRLTVLFEEKERKGSKIKYFCLCSCGNTVSVMGGDLRSGHTKSCGCYQLEQTSEKNGTHRKTKTKAWNAWINMRRRCYEVLCEMYPHYGGRGIKVCERWNPEAGGSFENFLADMGECPKHLSLDRIDVNKDYSPNNCRWASTKMQSFNRRLSPRNTTGKAGVRFVETLKNKWVASICIDKKLTHLGCFKTKEEAIVAREMAELEEYGEISGVPAPQTLLQKQVRKLRLAEDIDLERKQEEDE